MSTLERRVSFNNQILYSDDASEFTVSTDDELSLSSSDDDSLVAEANKDRKDNNSFMKAKVEFPAGSAIKVPTNDAAGKVAKTQEDDDVNAKPDNDVTQEETDDYAILSNDAPKEKRPESARKQEVKSLGSTEMEDAPSWQYTVKDEPPLIFRTQGVVHRPNEFLGGCPEYPAQTIKLRKSWVSNNSFNDNDEEYNEFEEWKKTRLSSKHGIFHSSKKLDALGESTSSFATCTEMEDESEKVEFMGEHNKKTDAGIEGTPPLATQVADLPPKVPALLIKPVLQNAATLFHDISKDCRDFKTASTNPVVENKKAVIKCDNELEVQKKEILKLQNHIDTLQKQFDVVEVCTVSQLADLEEETTRLMREAKAKATAVARQKRAQLEKKNLKEQAMKSEDCIDHYRSSNQRMRLEAKEMEGAIAKLRKSNLALVEKKELRLGYADQFKSFQKIEVTLVEQMIMTLNKDMPKYESLVRIMEEEVLEREKFCHIEARCKDLYLHCTQSLLELMDELCCDNSLMERLVGLAEGLYDEREVVSLDRDNGDDDRPAGTYRMRHNSDRSGMKTKNVTQPKASKTVRRHSSIRRIAEKKKPSSSPARKSPSVHSNRSPRSVVKIGSHDDDSSTCSISSIQSGLNSMEGYTVKHY